MSTKINVELIDTMGDDLRVANVARVSFNKWKDDFEERDAKLIKFLADHEHETPFRHCQVTVRCEAPIFIARQLGKHQVGMSWNEVSRRYVDNGVEFFEQDGWRKRPDGGIKQGSSEEVVTHLKGKAIDDVIGKYLDDALSLFDDMLEAGVAPELARQILPQSMMTTWIWTGSLTSFFHVYRLRIDGHAQREAQDFAKEIDRVVGEAFPECWKALKERK